MPEANIDKWKPHAESLSDDLNSKLAREAYLMQAAVSDSFSSGFEEAKKNPGAALAKAAATFGAGAVLASVAEMPSLAGIAGRSVLAGLTASSLCDLTDMGRVGKLTDAFADAWNSADNLKQDRRTIHDSLGSFVFDASILTATAAGGGLAAKHWKGLSREFPAHPAFKGSLEYDLGSGFSYKIEGARSELNTGNGARHYFYNEEIPTLTRTTNGQGHQITRFSNGDKLIVQPGEKATLQTERFSDKHLYIKYEQPRLTLSESQFAGKYHQRHLSYDNGVGILESGDGSFHIMANGNPRLSVTGKGMVYDPAAHETFNPQFGDKFNRLPPRPTFNELSDGAHVTQFANGAKLQVSGDGAVHVIGKNRVHDVPLSYQEGDYFPPDEWDYFKKTGEPKPGTKRSQPWDYTPKPEIMD